MELYRVTVSHKDTIAHAEWEKRLDAASRRAELFKEPIPKPVMSDVYVAVVPGFGGEPLGRAGELAVRKMVCTPERNAEYMPMVEKIEHIGFVWIEEQPKPESGQQCANA